MFRHIYFLIPVLNLREQEKWTKYVNLYFSSAYMLLVFIILEQSCKYPGRFFCEQEMCLAQQCCKNMSICLCLAQQSCKKFVSPFISHLHLLACMPSWTKATWVVHKGPFNSPKCSSEKHVKCTRTCLWIFQCPASICW